MGFVRRAVGRVRLLCLSTSVQRVAAGHRLKLGHVLRVSCGFCAATLAGRTCPSGFLRRAPAGDGSSSGKTPASLSDCGLYSLGTLDEQGLVDWGEVLLDGRVAPTKAGRQCRQQRGKGTKWMVVADGQGISLACSRLDRVAS